MYILSSEKESQLVFNEVLLCSPQALKIFFSAVITSFPSWGMRASPQYENGWLHSQLKFQFNVTLTANLDQLSQVFLKPTMKKKWFLCSKEATLQLCFRRSSRYPPSYWSSYRVWMNHRKEWTEQLCGNGEQGCPIVYLPDEKLIRTNPLFPLYLDRFGKRQ